MTSVDDCRLLDLARIRRPEGTITPVDSGVDLPFEIERVYYLYDIPAGAARGGHAHRALEQVIVCAMGAFTVTLKDGRTVRRLELNRAHVGLYIPTLIWRELDSFSAGSVCVVLASQHFEEADYIRDYGDFATLKESGE